MSIETKADKVLALLRRCLTDDVDNAQLVEGLTVKFAFDPIEVKVAAKEIAELLDAMPPKFHAEHGGGASVLELYLDRDGHHWAEQPVMEALVVLGIAAGLAGYCLPRHLWSSLPEGMPYVYFDTRPKAVNERVIHEAD